MNDCELLESIKNGDDLAFKALFEKYWDDLFKLAYKRLRSKEDAHDLVQDVFISFWRNVSNMPVDISISGYLFVSLRNKIFNAFSKKSSHLKYIINQPASIITSENLVWHHIQCKELQAVIDAEIARMPEKMKEIYLLSREQQLTIAEIGCLLIIAPQTVKNQLHRALERIRQSVRKNDFLLLFLFF